MGRCEETNSGQRNSEFGTEILCPATGYQKMTALKQSGGLQTVRCGCDIKQISFLVYLRYVR